MNHDMTVILLSKLISDLSIEDLNKLIKSGLSSQELADAYSEARIKYCYVEDASYDYEEGTEEYKRAIALTDICDEILDDLEVQIIKAATEEGLLADSQPDLCAYERIERFMNKYGYFNSGTWWLKKEV